MRIVEHLTIDALKALVLYKALHVMRLRKSTHHQLVSMLGSHSYKHIDNYTGGGQKPGYLTFLVKQVKIFHTR